jgi:1-acyl-sn-glycerol-3-phosphate acyltransferase
MKILYYSGWLLTRMVSGLIFRIRVTGQENIPKRGGFILASNHISYYDPPLLGSWSTRQMYFFAKAELFRNRLFGGIIKRTNAIPVKRGTIDRGAVDRALEAISRGYGLVVFPEGTRSRSGEFLDPKGGLGMLAIRAQCPIVPAYVHGADKLKACFWGGERLSISFGRQFGTDWLGQFPESKEAYESLSREVMGHISDLKARVAGAKKAD